MDKVIILTAIIFFLLLIGVIFILVAIKLNNIRKRLDSLANLLTKGGRK